MSTEVLLSPAKVNLTLQVLRKRGDGYHDLYTIYQKVALFDEITVEEASQFELEFEAEEEVPLTKNLLYRAYRLMAETCKIKEGFKVRVRKKIPLGAGLGGGSSNAGTFLKFLGKRYGVPKGRLLELGRQLGADVPFFVEDDPAAEAFGIGEILSPFPSFSAYYLLYYPGFKVETAWAFQSLGLQGERVPYRYSPTSPPWRNEHGLLNNFKELLYQRYPEYQVYEKILLDSGAKGVSISGTGSVIFGVFEEEPPRRLKNFLKDGKIYCVPNLL